MAALAQRRANAYAVGVGGNGGKDSPVNWEDRCARLQEENRQLKTQRNEQDQLMTDLNTRFRKLMRDYKALSGTAPPKVDGPSSSGHGATSAATRKIAQLERERDNYARQVQDLKRQLRMLPGTGNAPASLGLHPKNMNFRQESIDDYLGRQEREAIRSGSGDAGGSRSARSARSTKSIGGSSSHGRLTSASMLLSEVDVTPEKQRQSGGSTGSRPSSGSPHSQGAHTANNKAAMQQYEAKIAQLNADIDMLQQQRQRDNDRIYQLEGDLRRAQAAVAAAPEAQVNHAQPNPYNFSGGSGSTPSAPLSALPPVGRSEMLPSMHFTPALPQEQPNRGVSDPSSVNLFPNPAAGGTTTTAAAGATPMSNHHHGPSSTLDSAELQSLRHQVQALTAQHRAAENELEMVKRERDGLEFKLRLRPTGEDYQGYRTTDADPNTLLTLQQEVSEKSTQMAVLTSRFTTSQEQVGLMKKECDRLVDEIKNSHQQLNDSTRKAFELEQQKCLLELKADRVNELEVAHRLKSDEVIQYEQKMLALADRLTTCTRETEHQVRRSCNERFTELEGMRDEADRARRAKEGDCLTMQHDLGDARAKVKALNEQVESYKADVGKLRTENRELHEKASFLGAVPQDMTDDVHKAMAMVNLKKKREDELDVGELWQGIEWSDGWEAGRMREAVSTATYDLQLAEQRYQQINTNLEDKTSLLRGISDERDQLLNENIELRRRISGIQTTLTKRMLKAQNDSISAVVGGGVTNGRAGCLSITLTHIDCNPAITTVPQGSASIFTPTLFFTLDGLDGYELAMGDNFYTVIGEVSTVFVFSGLPITLASMEKILQSHFTLQLHQSYGTECDVVAAATISGAHLLSDFHGSGVVNLRVPLVGQQTAAGGGDAAVGSVTGTVVLSEEFIPFLLERKLVPPMTLSHEAMNANLLSLRGVSGLRVQIFKASGLKATHTGAVPQPYVFYTVLNLPTGMASFINDTVVHPRGELVTTDPTFDQATPCEHPVVMDATILHFFLEASISFIVFDAVSADFESNLGMVSVPLRPLLESAGTTIQVAEQLHPQGSLEVGLSWVSAH